MFERFFDFVKQEEEVVFNSSEEFLKAMGGRTFLNGIPNLCRRQPAQME